MALPPGVDNCDLEYYRSPVSRWLDDVETGACEGCGNQFEVGELDEIADIDPDLHWCEGCRQLCECGHILGVHAVVVRSGRAVDGCDGNHGEPGECDCRGFVAKVPAAVVAAAKAIPKGLWMSDRFREQLRRER